MHIFRFFELINLIRIFHGSPHCLGWDILNFATEEIENPRRVLPVAALCGIGISALVYVLINVAYFSVMTIDEFKQSQAVAVVSNLMGIHFGRIHT